jgi:D-lyxose ketol-isomerase
LARPDRAIGDPNESSSRCAYEWCVRDVSRETLAPGTRVTAVPTVKGAYVAGAANRGRVVVGRATAASWAAADPAYTERAHRYQREP